MKTPRASAKTRLKRETLLNTPGLALTSAAPADLAGDNLINLTDDEAPGLVFAARFNAGGSRIIAVPRDLPDRAGWDQQCR